MLINSYHDRQARHIHKRMQILEFLRDEIWSDAKTLSRLIGVSEVSIYKTLNKLQKHDFIKSHYIPELRFRIWGLTQMGLLYAWGDEEQMQSRPCFEPSKVKPAMIQHHLDLQRARLNASHCGWYNWLPGNLLPRHIDKRPDAIATSSDDMTIAIEIERTVKTRKRYEAIFSLYLQAIKRGNYHYVHYVCPTIDFAKRIQRLFSTINSVPVAGQRVTITDKHRARFPVYALEQWPPKQKEME